MLNSGTPEGTSSSLTLTEDAWDLLGLGAADAISDRDLHIKNGQVCLLTGGDYMNAKRRYALDNREAQRAQWRQQAEQRLAKALQHCWHLSSSALASLTLPFLVAKERLCVSLKSTV